MLAKKIEEVPMYPAELWRVESDFKGIKVRRAEDSGRSPDNGVRYLLQWESLDGNRDRPRKPPLPEPSMLRLYRLSENK
jgi:hypothetical protein